MSAKQTKITDGPWAFACQWYKVEDIHRNITQVRYAVGVGDLDCVPPDVSSLEFAEWLTEQYRLAMCKGAQLAIKEMQGKASPEIGCNHCACQRCYNEQLQSQQQENVS